jgi:hypothetical protein
MRRRYWSRHVATRKIKGQRSIYQRHRLLNAWTCTQTQGTGMWAQGKGETHGRREKQGGGSNPIRRPIPAQRRSRESRRKRNRWRPILPVCARHADRARTSALPQAEGHGSGKGFAWTSRSPDPGWKRQWKAGEASRRGTARPAN